MRSIILLMLFFISCSKYCVEFREYGVDEVVSIDKRKIIKIDTIYIDDGGMTKRISIKTKN